MTYEVARQRNQVTIPKAIAEQVGITEGTVLDLQLGNISIIISTPGHGPANFDPMEFAGTGKGLWGSTLEEIDAAWQGVRDSSDRETLVGVDP